VALEHALDGFAQVFQQMSAVGDFKRKQAEAPWMWFEKHSDTEGMHLLRPCFIKSAGELTFTGELNTHSRHLDPGKSLAGRLTGRAVRLIVAGIARLAGLDRVCRPHRLRHAAIIEALDRGRDVRDVAKFSRHKDVRTLLIYDDSRRDVGGDIARMLEN
jgi:integrase